MKTKYAVFASVDMAKTVGPVSDVVKNLNTHLAKMGCDERIMVRSGEFRLWTLTSDREYTEQEIAKMKDVIQEAVGNQLGIKVSDIRKSTDESCSKST